MDRSIFSSNAWNEIGDFLPVGRGILEFYSKKFFDQARQSILSPILDTCADQPGTQQKITQEWEAMESKVSEHLASRMNVAMCALLSFHIVGAPELSKRVEDAMAEGLTKAIADMVVGFPVK